MTEFNSTKFTVKNMYKDAVNKEFVSLVSHRMRVIFYDLGLLNELNLAIKRLYSCLY